MEKERVTKALQQSQQDRWTMLEVVVRRSIGWNEIWRRSPLAFVIRSIYDQLPSKDNLLKLGLTEDCKCEFCDESEPLHHVLSNSKYALDNDRYTWRHNKVLKEVVEAIKMWPKQILARLCCTGRYISVFLARGLFTTLQETQTPSEERHSHRGQ